MTAVEYLVKEFSDILGPLDTKPMQDLLLVDAMKRAKEMENEQSQKYAEFAIRCDRMDMRILNFDDYMKLDVVTEYRDGTIERDESNN